MTTSKPITLADLQACLPADWHASLNELAETTLQATTPLKLSLVGAFSVGKSSLLNRLIRRDRALVSPEPGTTRDFIEERIIVGPHCLRIIDTAGLNPSPAPLEKLGMDKTMERAAEADLFLLVFDSTAPRPVLPVEIASRVTSSNSIIILNKRFLYANRYSFVD